MQWNLNSRTYCDVRRYLVMLITLCLANSLRIRCNLLEKFKEGKVKIELSKKVKR
jgi:hypothetical protein